jgi:hypothetical protein
MSSDFGDRRTLIAEVISEHLRFYIFNNLTHWQPDDQSFASSPYATESEHSEEFARLP